jgi:serine/threonine-protein kinase
VSLLIIILSLSFLNTERTNAISEDASSKAQFYKYDDPIHGVKVQYPSNWTIDKIQTSNYDDVTKIVGFIKDPNSLAGDFLISVHNLTNDYVNKTVDLSKLLNSTIDYYKGYYHDFNLIESKYNVSFSNFPNSAYRLVWIDTEEPYTIKSMQIGTIIGNKAYLVRYYAELEKYSDNLPLIERMIYSLEINNKNLISSSQ